MSKLRIELEPNDWQGVMTLINAGGIYASLAPQYLRMISEQLQAQQQAAVPRSNGADQPLEERSPSG